MAVAVDVVGCQNMPPKVGVVLVRQKQGRGKSRNPMLVVMTADAYKTLRHLEGT